VYVAYQQWTTLANTSYANAIRSTVTFKRCAASSFVIFAVLDLRVGECRP